MDEVYHVNGFISDVVLSAGHKLYNHMGKPWVEGNVSQEIHPVENRS